MRRKALRGGNLNEVIDIQTQADGTSGPLGITPGAWSVDIANLFANVEQKKQTQTNQDGQIVSFYEWWVTIRKDPEKSYTPGVTRVVYNGDTFYVNNVVDFDRRHVVLICKEKQ